MNQHEPANAASPVELESSIFAALESAQIGAPQIEDLFAQHLLDHLRVGVIFIDAQCNIKTWSQAVEIMSGISNSNAVGNKLCPELLNLTHPNGQLVNLQECPFGTALRTGKVIKEEYKIVGRSGREVKTDLNIVPVKSQDDVVHGAVIMVHDTSIQRALQRQLQDLYQRSMLDPLTQVANRAEFERVLTDYVKAHQVTTAPCSLIICDIDFFKQINDTYGHHIGDQALIAFAGLLKNFVRNHDVVARYGGEEFVILCANCDSEAAVERAEEIRSTLAKTPQQMLNGKCINASFGVSELKATDSETDFFVRADKALLAAKERGRNRVVHASSCEENLELTSAETKSLSGVTWRKSKGNIISCDEFQTATPMSVLVEKLRGYIIEKDAEIHECESDFASVKIESADAKNPNRVGKFWVELEFQEGHSDCEEKRNVSFIRLTMRPVKAGWFSSNAVDLAPQVVREIREFFMINDESSKLQVAPAATKPGKR